MAQDNVWMLVSSDEYKLPLCVADSAGKLAKKLNTTTSNIISRFSKYGDSPRARIVRVDVGDLEEEEEKELVKDMARRLKAGELAYIVKDSGVLGAVGQQVVILATDIEGIHSVKVKDIKTNNIFYVEPSDLSKRKAQALKKEPCLPISPEIKKAAQKAAESKIEGFQERKKKEMEKEKDLPTFSDVKEKFYALASMVQVMEEEQDSMTESNKRHSNIIIQLAEKALWNEIKDGVRA